MVKYNNIKRFTHKLIFLYLELNIKTIIGCAYIYICKQVLFNVMEHKYLAIIKNKSETQGALFLNKCIYIYIYIYIKMKFEDELLVREEWIQMSHNDNKYF